VGVFEPSIGLLSWFTRRGQVFPTDHEISIYGTKSHSPSRTTSTGQGARRTTLSVVLPSKKCFRAVYQWVAITIRSTANSVATSTISSYGTPKRCNVSIFMLFSRTSRASVSSFSAHRCLAASNCFFVSSFESYEKSGGSCRTNSGNSKTWKRIKLSYSAALAEQHISMPFQRFWKNQLGLEKI